MISKNAQNAESQLKLYIDHQRIIKVPIFATGVIENVLKKKKLWTYKSNMKIL